MPVPYPPVEPPQVAIAFPDPRRLGRREVLAVGEDFRPYTLIEAYRRGVFPWPHTSPKGNPLVLWFSPNPRAIFPLEAPPHWSRSLRRTLRQHPYQVTVDEFTRNRSPAQVENAAGRAGRLKLPPLGVNLSYLIAPMVDDQYAAQTALAAVMLALYETPLFPVELPGAEVSEVVRVSFVPDTLEERAKLWEVVSRPYRLSVCYQVRTVRLVSKQVSADAAIVSTAAGIEEKPAPRVVE